MADNNTGLIELAKYPVLVFSIVIALVIVRYALDLEFGMVTEVSTEGLKFSEKSNKATLQALTELEAQLNDISVRLQALEEGGAGASNVDTRAQAAAAFSAAQAVSDTTAKIASLASEIPGAEKKSVTGWIWIGNYEDGWSTATLSQLDSGQPIEISPGRMVVGTRYKALGNMVIRDGLPPNNKAYYRAQKSLGVVPRGAVVTLLQAPSPVDREFAVQYWAQVEYSIDTTVLF